MSESTPADRFGHLFELIGDPVVEIELVSGEPIVRDVNPAFEAVFGYDRERVLEESLNDFIVPDGASGEANRFDRRTAAGKHNTGLVTRETAAGPREFFYRGVPYERDGGQYGFAIYTDVTEQRRYERHFQVIHRLLRHDLRNDLQVILGAANRIAAQTTDPALAELSETIADRANRLAAAGEETKVIEQVLIEDHEPEPLDVARMCRQVAADCADQYPDARISSDTPDSLAAAAIPSLHTAIEALVENAALHAGESPRVEVTARHRGDRVTVEVADDGPGIPEQHRRPVFEDQQITQLSHNRGIGLWLVRWVTEACGGSLGYERTDGRTVVRLWLHTPSTAQRRGADG